jgi:hypothetical protein
MNEVIADFQLPIADLRNWQLAIGNRQLEMEEQP